MSFLSILLMMMMMQIHVIAPDLPGFGKSDPLPDGTPATLKAYTDSIKQMLADKGIQKAIIGGCSWGGYMMFEIWRHYPSIVSGFIFVDTRADADPPEAKERRQKQIEQIRASGSTEFLVDAMAPNVVSPKTRENQKETYEWVREAIRSSRPKAVVDALTAIMNRADSTDLLKEINVPSLVLVGKDDGLTPPSLAQSLHEKLPQSRMEIIADAGHLCPLEQPDQVNPIILKFLEDFNLAQQQ
eukprot:GEZU01010381.1.p1 GENE.GEZU01010381.1~~GEZU01010381.1.p1  ORF type:complete len:242 (+),score=78.64 GEZU01010381.1:151-876(+)